MKLWSESTGQAGADKRADHDLSRATVLDHGHFSLWFRSVLELNRRRPTFAVIKRSSAQEGCGNSQIRLVQRPGLEGSPFGSDLHGRQSPEEPSLVRISHCSQSRPWRATRTFDERRGHRHGGLCETVTRAPRIGHHRHVPRPGTTDRRPPIGRRGRWPGVTCGIAGVIRSVPPPIETGGAAILAALAHRGPDDEGQWRKARVGWATGDCRSSTFLRRGHQPMVSACAAT